MGKLLSLFIMPGKINNNNHCLASTDPAAAAAVEATTTTTSLQNRQIKIMSNKKNR